MDEGDDHGDDDKDKEKNEEMVGRGDRRRWSSRHRFHEAPQAALKSWIATRRRIDPKRALCPADLLGRCNDDKCTKLHARDFEPTGAVSFSSFLFLFPLFPSLHFACRLAFGGVIVVVLGYLGRATDLNIGFSPFSPFCLSRRDCRLGLPFLSFSFSLGLQQMMT
jgi:hypothetical protein